MNEILEGHRMACNPGRSALGRIPKENSKCQRYGLPGGKDSAALAVYMRDRLLEMEYIFHDTDKELPETLVSRAAAKRAGGWRPELGLRPGIRGGPPDLAWPSSSAIRRCNRSITRCCSRTVACSWAMMAMRTSRVAVVRSISVSTPCI